MAEKEINKIKMEIIEAGKRMLHKDLVIGTAGNISVRISGEDRILVTPSHVEYDKTEIDDILVVDSEGNVLEGDRNPSIETGMHIGVYKARPDVGAVVHSHAICTSAIASLGKTIPPFLDGLVSTIGGEIEVAEYGMPGSEELAENAVRALGEKNAVLLANHGSLCCGKNLKDALENTELVERVAQIFIFSSILGKPRNLPQEVVELQQGIFEMMR
ncbi:MAG TPA: class II aldolase/adducin family protein [Thermoplasmata archaeon]|nr:class II aldolase/adducin family protein [Thermoplasmata archaeon]